MTASALPDRPNLEQLKKQAKSLLRAAHAGDPAALRHRAAMGGHPDAVRVLLKFGADVNALYGMFSATPLVWTVEGRDHAQPGTDHIAVARELMAAGSSLEWTPPEGAPGPERTLEGLIELRRAAIVRDSR